MNERIKDLANDAAKYSAIMSLPTGRSGDELFIEKFSELLINESIKVMTENDYHGEWLGEKLKEYFGIKTNSNQ